MNRTVINTLSIMILFSSFVFAEDNTKRENLPAHKQAQLAPVDHDVVPGYVEKQPLNDVIRSAEPRDNSNKQPASLKTTITPVQSSNRGTPSVELNENNIGTILRKYENKQFLTEEEENILGDYFARQQSASRPSITGRNNNRTAMSEGFEDTFPPTGWTNTLVSGHDWEQSSSYANTGTYSAKYKGSSGGPHTGELVTPRLDLTVGATDSLVYYLRNASWYGDQNECAVSISTDLGTTWTLITNHNTDVTSFTRYAHALESYTQNDSVYIKFLGEDNWGYGVYIDDVTGPDVWVDPNPVALFDLSSIDFGNTGTAGVSSPIVVTNNGGSALSISSIAVANPDYSVSASSASVASGASETITVTYAPTVAEGDTSYVIFTHDGASSPDTVLVKGAGVDAVYWQDFEGWAASSGSAVPLPIGMGMEGNMSSSSDGASYGW